MNGTINNFYTSVRSAFTKPKPMIYFLASKVSYLIMEAILTYDLEVQETDSYFARYTNENGLDIRIWLDDINSYRLEINNNPVHTEIPEDLLNDLIITELQIP